jgi:hypothetical protein
MDAADVMSHLTGKSRPVKRFRDTQNGKWRIFATWLTTRWIENPGPTSDLEREGNLLSSFSEPQSRACAIDSTQASTSSPPRLALHLPANQPGAAPRTAGLKVASIRRRFIFFQFAWHRLYHRPDTGSNGVLVIAVVEFFLTLTRFYSSESCPLRQPPMRSRGPSMSLPAPAARAYAPSRPRGPAARAYGPPPARAWTASPALAAPGAATDSHQAMRRIASRLRLTNG